MHDLSRILSPLGPCLCPTFSQCTLALRLQLIDDSAACQAMGEFNRRRWEKEFTVEAFRTRWCDFLHGWLEDEQKATA